MQRTADSGGRERSTVKTQTLGAMNRNRLFPYRIQRQSNTAVRSEDLMPHR
jgi:hypothetical protein